MALKYAFWPGCVSKGAAPELYRLDEPRREGARHRAGGAGPRRLHRRRRHPGAEPGDGRRAQRAHVRAGAAAGPAADEHLLDVPGHREHGAGQARPSDPEYLAKVNAILADEGLHVHAGPGDQELPLGARRGLRPRQAEEHGQAAADRPARRAVLRLLHPPPERDPRHGGAPGARPLPRDDHRGGRRDASSTTRARRSAAASRS